MSKTLLKSARRCFYVNFPLISDKSRTERSLLVRYKILALCSNKLTGDHMYSHLKREIFPQLVRTQLVQKPKTFYQIFMAFFQATSNLEHFGKKDELHTLNLSEFIDTEACGFLNAQKLLLQNTLLNSTS